MDLFLGEYLFAFKQLNNLTMIRSCHMSSLKVLLPPMVLVYSIFPSCFKFSLVFINMQLRSFSYRISRRKELSKCATKVV